MASNGGKKPRPPAFNLAETSFEDYLWDLDVWKTDKNLVKADMARDVYQSLPASDPTMIKAHIRNKIDKSLMDKEEGFDLLVQLMTEHLSGDTLLNAWRKYCEYDGVEFDASGIARMSTWSTIVKLAGTRWNA